MPSGLKPEEIGFWRIRRLLGSCRDEPGRFRDPDWNGASRQETKRSQSFDVLNVEHPALRKTVSFHTVTVTVPWGPGLRGES